MGEIPCYHMWSKDQLIAVMLDCRADSARLDKLERILQEHGPARALIRAIFGKGIRPAIDAIKED